MQLIQTATVGAGGAANITFSSIPQTFTDLLLVMSLRSGSGNSDGDPIYVNFNSAGSTNYASASLMFGSNTIYSFTGTTANIGITSNSANTANTFSVSSAYIPSYTTSTNKIVTSDGVAPNNTNFAGGRFDGTRWSNTAAITSMVITPNAGNFLEFSTISLYGILRGSGGATVS